jgi:hypothetical protein
VQQSTSEVTVKPLEFHSIFVGGRLVSFFLAPSNYCALPRERWSFAEPVDAP